MSGKKKKSSFNVKFNEAKEQIEALSQVTAQEHISIEAEDHESPKEAEHESIKTPEHQNIQSETNEKATDRTTINFTPSQTEKLAHMAIDYKKRTGKKIVANEIIRRLVEKSSLKDIL